MSDKLPHTQTLEQAALGTIEHNPAVTELVCPVSLEAARTITEPLLQELALPDSVLYAVIADRAARMNNEQQLALARALSVDPLRTGIRVPRFRLQDGIVPDDAPVTPEQAIALWSVPSEEQIPKLQVPAGKEAAIVELSKRLGLYGGGPLIFERSEVEGLDVSDGEIITIAGAARNANRQRIRTALEIAKHHSFRRPLLATVDAQRELNAEERAVVASFAPNARNEQQLFVDSARAEGFELQPCAYGAILLPDGSTYNTMEHAETGVVLRVLAPAKTAGQTGLANGYAALMRNGTELFNEPDFVLDGSDVLYITSTHYGAMAAMNNIRAVRQYSLQLNRFRVVGDNQPTRTAQAHLIEIGLALNAFADSSEDPALRAGLLRD